MKFHADDIGGVAGAGEIRPGPFSNGMLILRATPADAGRAASLAVRTFTETFGHLYPPQDLDDFLRTSYSVEAHQRILADDNYALLLLEHDGEAIGHALAGPCGLPHPEANLADGELKRLYVLQHAHNRGWGGKLFETALDWLQRDGPRPLWIGVWSENLGAQRFYARYGFGKVGEYEFPVGATRDREFILRRDACLSIRGKVARHSHADAASCGSDGSRDSDQSRLPSLPRQSTCIPPCGNNGRR